MPKGPGCAALLAWLCAVAPIVWAGPPAVGASACAVPYIPQPLSAQDIAGAIAVLTQDLNQCQTSGPWLAQLGYLLNRQGRYEEAEAHLERALMLVPELQSAQLDYAIALAGQGNTATALALINDLLTDSDLPPHLRAILQRQATRWSQPAPAQATWQGGGAINVRAGWDSNLLGSPNLSTLTLTTPGQSVVLPLDEAYRPAAGTYLRTDAQWGWRKTDALGAQWQLGAALRARHSPGLLQAAFSQYDLQIERQHNGSYLGASLSGLYAQTGTRYQALGLAGGYARGAPSTPAQGGCQARAGLELQDRRSGNNPLLSGVYMGLAGTWSCPDPFGNSWYMALKTGRDTARAANRAGGDQTQTLLRLVAQRPVTSMWAAMPATLVADVEWARAQDQAAYSPLLENGAPRNTSRMGARAELQHTLRPNLQWVVGLEWAVQRSNLPLFDTASWGPYSSLRWVW